MELLSMNPRLKSNFLEGEQEAAMLESCLTFLASLMSVRTNIGKRLTINHGRNMLVVRRMSWWYFNI